MIDRYQEGERRDATPSEAATPTDDGGGYKCPECGEQLADMNQRSKHAIMHYGDDLIPPYPDQNLAAERKGALLDVEPETLRGFPRRR